MADQNTPTRNARTKRDIKRALLELLAKKSLDTLSMSEIAREAQVSRSTLYQHYGNVFDIYSDAVEDFRSDVSPVMSRAACFDGIEPEGTRPFCDLLRDGQYRAVTECPQFLDTYLMSDNIGGNPVFMETLTAAGYSPEIARALSTFQLNGCFKAVKAYGANDALWHEVREAIDTFICGGLEACCERKEHQLAGKKANL